MQSKVRQSLAFTDAMQVLDLSGYKLTFDDEFNSFSSNGPSNYQVKTHTGTWDTTYSYGERKLNDEVQLYSDSSIGVNPFSVSSGVLSIHATPSPDPSKTQGQTYTSGAITTYHSFSQQYGYFEIRAKLPAGQGFWPAFWMLPVQHVWPPEIDILEGFGATNANGEGGAGTYHAGIVQSSSNGPSGVGAWESTSGANLYTQYNTFGVDWQADKTTFYFNGESVGSIATPAEFKQPMFLLANLAVGGHWAGPPTGQSGDLKIDYIRGFSKDGYNPAVAQDTASSPDGGGYSLYGATDARGGTITGDIGSGAPPKVVLSQTVGSGADDLTLYMSEDAYQGDAQFVVTVDGKQIGGTLTAQASHATNQTQAFHILGTYGTGSHVVGVKFVNDSYGGSAGADRNLYAESATINGALIGDEELSFFSSGEKTFSFSMPVKSNSGPSSGSGQTGSSGPDTIALKVSEDAYQGDAQYTVAVNGTTIGGVRTTTASHAAGNSDEVILKGAFAPGATVQIKFLNDAYDGSPSTDRNLYASDITYNGVATSPDKASFLASGAIDFKSVGNVSILLSEDAYQGDAMFSIAVDGKTVIKSGTVTAQQGLGQTQAVALPGALSSGTHDIAVSFLNDAYGGSSGADRNLYVLGAQVPGNPVSGFSAILGTGTQHYSLYVP